MRKPHILSCIPVSSILTDIAHRNGIGDHLAEGTKRLSEKMGGTEFAIQVKGLEMAAYDPRGSWGQGLAYAVANRGGCHLSAVNSLHTCQFAAFSYVLEPPIVKYTPKPMLGLTMQYMPKIAVKLIFIHVLSNFYSSITGIKVSQKQFLEAGERIHILERLLNTNEGISRKDDQLPQRILKEKRTNPSDKGNIPLEKMLDDYYKLRGYDENGIPKPETLKRLGIIIHTSSLEKRRMPFKATITTI